MRLINKIFKKSGDGDRRDIVTYPAGFRNVDEPYDEVNHIARYHFTQCPNAEFAKAHDLLHVLPLMCNSDFFGIEQIHGTLIRCGTCGNSDICDYCVVGNRNPLANEGVSHRKGRERLSGQQEGSLTRSYIKLFCPSLLRCAVIMCCVSRTAHMLTWYRCRKHKGTSIVSYSFTCSWRGSGRWILRRC